MKKIFAFILALVMVATLFSGCGVSPATAYDSEMDAMVEVVFADLAQIPDHDYLYYSTTTRTVYYLFEKGANWNHAVVFLGPYIRNGHNCEYIDGQIVEVVPTVKILELVPIEDATD